MDINHDLLQFLNNSPTAFHAVRCLQEQLNDCGYTALRENEPWNLVPGGSYYVSRSSSALIAFRIPSEKPHGFMIAASHSDSPGFKIKPNPEIKQDGYVKLNVEGYGGYIASTWFDRPLTVGGRVFVRTEHGTEQRLIYINRDLFVIPSLAIHMDRTVNEGHKYDIQKELLPLFRSADAGISFQSMIAEAAGAPESDILSQDLFLCQRTPGFVFGGADEFICSPHLDDLQCGFADFHGFLAAEPSKSIPVFAVFDNEEVGSLTRQGAAGTFLNDVLQRILHVLSITEEEAQIMYADSFLISADNAHAVHPNYPEKADPNCRPRLNGGVVLKYSAPQLYTSDALSAAVFKELCREAGVPVQEFVNHSNIRGGSTLGHLTNNHLSLHSADIGLPQLAMHSGVETAGAQDTQYLIDVMKVFFARSLYGDGETTIAIR